MVVLHASQSCVCQRARRDPHHKQAQRPLHLPSPFDVGVTLLCSLELALIKSLGKQEASVESLISSLIAQSSQSLHGTHPGCT